MSAEEEKYLHTHFDKRDKPIDASRSQRQSTSMSTGGGRGSQVEDVGASESFVASVSISRGRIPRCQENPSCAEPQLCAGSLGFRG